MRRNRRPNPAGEVITLICFVGVVLIGTILAIGVFDPGHADPAQPYGGCKEAHLAPHSAGAQDCRAHGWTVRGRIVVNRHGVVKYLALPHCREEDGSGQRPTCGWNLGGRTDGNGRGLSYFVDRHDRVHYVWPERPLGEPTPAPLADALAEGERHEDWATCWLEETPTHVRCPDGYRTRVYGQRGRA